MLIVALCLTSVGQESRPVAGRGCVHEYATDLHASAIGPPWLLTDAIFSKGHQDCIR